MRSLLILLAIPIIFAPALAGAEVNRAKLSPTLHERSTSDDEWLSVVAVMTESSLNTPRFSVSMLKSSRKPEFHSLMIAELKTKNGSDNPFVDRLREFEAVGMVRSIDTYWIANAISFEVKSSLLDELTNMDELEILIDDQPLELVEPVSQIESESGFAGSNSYMTQIGVRDLWEMGYTGHGRLVCSFDTGVEGSHPALSATWLGNEKEPTQAWFDPFGTSTPSDLAGHGTHTMGLMVGREVADTIGVAFNARWMAAAVIDRGQTLNKTISDILAAFEWAADPDGNPNSVDDVPDVICNSWGIPKGLMQPCDQSFWQAIDNLEALGVVVVFACGNEGPNAGTIRNPADRATSPLNSFSIGAVDQTQPDLPVAAFSSRGPAGCDNSHIKPELVAPGVLLRSSFKGGEYRQMSGTSMAAPVVAGCIALMREYNPEATVQEIKNALIQSAADLGSVGQDNDYGYGCVNVREALNYLPSSLKPRIQVASLQLSDSDNGILQVGNTTPLNLTISNSSVAAVNLTGVLRSGNQHVFILDNEAIFGNAPTEALVSNPTNPYLVKIDHSAIAGTEAEFTVDFYSQQYGYLNSADFKIIIGQPVVASLATISTDRLNVELTNFGLSRRFTDLAESVDHLSSLSLMIADQQGNVFDALSDGLDFLATDSIRNFSSGSSIDLRTQFNTTDNQFEVSLNARAFDELTRNNFVILEYSIDALTEDYESISGVGVAFDFDFSGGETVIQDGEDFLIRSADYGRYIGIRPLPYENSFGISLDGFELKNGTLSDVTKHELLTGSQTSLNPMVSEQALVVGFGPIEGAAHLPLDVAYVIASGNSVEEIKVALQAGQAAYNQATDVKDDDDVILPDAFSLAQNFPNPFNAETRIDFSLPFSGDYRLEIINSLGQLVRVIDATGVAAGFQHVVWNGKNADGFDVASGMYFYRLSFNGHSQTRKMVLLK